MLRTDDFVPFAAPSTAAFGETNRQDSRFACIAPKGRGTGMCRVSSPKGRCMDAARCQRAKDGPSGNPRRIPARGTRARSTGYKRQPGRLLTRAIQALALRVLRIQICSRQICLWLLSFGDAKESNSPSGATNRQDCRFARHSRLLRRKTGMFFVKPD
jgi:hypothetical protein